MNGLIIISAICKKLHQKYPDISIYREHIEDNFDTPSFFVWESGMSYEPLLFPRMIQRHRVEVRFFPVIRSTSMYEELLNVGMQLLEHLNFIDVEIGSNTMPVFVINPTYSIINDNTLQFSAEYRIESVIDDGTNKIIMGDIERNVVFK